MALTTPEKERFLRTYLKDNFQATQVMAIAAVRKKFGTGVAPNVISILKREVEAKKNQPYRIKANRTWKEEGNVKHKTHYEARIVDISKLAPSDEDKEKQVLELALQIANIIDGSNIKVVTIDEKGAELSVLRLERKRQDRGEQPAPEAAQS